MIIMKSCLCSYIVLRPMRFVIMYKEDANDSRLRGSSSGAVRVRGRCNTKYGLSRFWAERGTETWIVDCVCGTKDDDGERMLACDNCSIWQHTRCVGIDGLRFWATCYSLNIMRIEQCFRNNERGWQSMKACTPLVQLVHLPCTVSVITLYTITNSCFSVFKD